MMLLQLKPKLSGFIRNFCKHSSIHYQFARYGVIGLISNITFYVVSNANYIIFEHAYMSSLIGWLASFFTSLIGHGLFTYKSLITTSVIIKYICLALLNLSLIQILTYYGDVYMKWEYWTTSFLIILIIPIFAFLLGRYVVFIPNSRRAMPE